MTRINMKKALVLLVLAGEFDTAVLNSPLSALERFADLR
jgi:hypothetical protein